MIASGVAIGFVYDVCRFVFRGREGKRTVSDIIFWIACCTISLFAFFYSSRYEIRLYLVLGLACGWAVYVLLFSRAIEFFLSPIKQLISAIGDFFDFLRQKARSSRKRISAAAQNASLRFWYIKKYIFGQRAKPKKQPRI